MTIIEFFNPDDEDHLLAYKYLQQTGFWPEGFIPNDLAFTIHWASMLAGILADKYIKLKCKGDWK